QPEQAGSEAAGPVELVLHGPPQADRLHCCVHDARVADDAREPRIAHQAHGTVDEHVLDGAQHGHGPVCATGAPLRQREPRGMLVCVFAGAERGPKSFSAFVTGTFVFGWVVGLASVLKLWQLAHAPRWMMWTGVGYITLMLAPAATGF